MSNKAKSQSKLDNLLAAVKQKAPTNTPPESKPSLPAPEPDAPVSPPAAHAGSATKETKGSRVGKPVQFWLHDEDRRLLRELSAWLAGQGERPTDSMVLRSVLRVTKTGDGLLKAYRQASQLDGRLKQRKSA